MTTTPIDAFIPADIRALYEIHNYRNAAQVLATGCPEEFKEIIEGLRAFRLTLADIRKPGGNESDIPKRISGLLRARGWMETRIKGDLLITKVSGSSGKKTEEKSNDEGGKANLRPSKRLKSSRKKATTSSTSPVKTFSMDIRLIT